MIPLLEADLDEGESSIRWKRIIAQRANFLDDPHKLGLIAVVVNVETTSADLARHVERFHVTNQQIVADWGNVFDHVWQIYALLNVTEEVMRSIKLEATRTVRTLQRTTLTCVVC